MEYWLLIFRFEHWKKLKKFKITGKELSRRVHRFDDLKQLNGVKIRFCYMLSRKIPEASYFFGNIICSPGWAVRLVFNCNERTENAFLMTLGHEVSHRIEYKSKLPLRPRDRKFVDWVNEVHCDFSGAKLMIHSNRRKFIDSVQYKSSIKRNNKDTNSHPSWKRRLEYATEYNFDKKLIERIARDTKCTNRRLIHNICGFFEPIILE